MSNSMNTNIVRNEVDPFDQIIALQQLNFTSLKDKAAEVGAKISETMDQGEVIDAIVAKMTEAPDSETEMKVEHGHLFSLHSRTDDAKHLIKNVRNYILANREAGVWFNLFLKNRDGDSYSRRVPGVRCTPGNMKSVLDIITPLPDGSQDKILNEFKQDPSSFKDPVLVMMRRRTKYDRYMNYVMLYLQRRQEDIIEQTF